MVPHLLPGVQLMMSKVKSQVWSLVCHSSLRWTNLVPYLVVTFRVLHQMEGLHETLLLGGANGLKGYFWELWGCADFL